MSKGIRTVIIVRFPPGTPKAEAMKITRQVADGVKNDLTVAGEALFGTACPVVVGCASTMEAE